MNRLALMTMLGALAVLVAVACTSNSTETAVPTREAEVVVQRGPVTCNTGANPCPGPDGSQDQTADIGAHTSNDTHPDASTDADFSTSNDGAASDLHSKSNPSPNGRANRVQGISS